MFSKKLSFKPIVLGKIGACYGIRGWLRLFSYTSKNQSIFKYQPWFIKISNYLEELKLENWRKHNNNFIIKLSNIDDRSTASLLTNCKIIVDSLQLPILKEGEYYWKDLIGCQVFTSKGRYIGKVVDLLETISNDILVIESETEKFSNTKKYLIPFINKKIIEDINITNQIIKVNWNFI